MKHNMNDRLRSLVEAKRDLYWRNLTSHKLSVLKKNEILRYLADHNYYVPTRLNRDELSLHVVRVQRGLPSVFGLSIEQLRDILVLNGHPKACITELSKKVAVSDVMPLAERAENNRKFERFSELPNEVQVMVFEWVVADLPPVLTTPAQHPLARLNKQLRSGFLPVFYKYCTFSLVFELRDSSKFFLTRDTADFLGFLLPKDIAQICKFEIEIPLEQRRWAGRQSPTLSFAVQLDQQAKNYTFKWIGRYDVEPQDQYTADRERRLRAHFLPQARKILDDVLAREPGTGRIKNNTMTITDFYRFRRAVEDVVSRHG